MAGPACNTKARAAKQGVDYANIVSGSSAKLTEKELQITIPVTAPPGSAELQAALQKGRDEMAWVSADWLTLQANVTSVKSTWCKMKTDVAALTLRLNEVENEISNLENENEHLKQSTVASA